MVSAGRAGRLVGLGSEPARMVCCVGYVGVGSEQVVGLGSEPARMV